MLPLCLQDVFEKCVGYPEFLAVLQACGQPTKELLGSLLDWVSIVLVVVISIVVVIVVMLLLLFRTNMAFKGNSYLFRLTPNVIRCRC